ncbi:hypothetical protein [uncultured Dysgonomonas sp.]|uniref:Uncharacterized protein n=1 Tax=uncultured Dysgonomonas sp. TaxID=206096 RepID=A0A212K6G2_9BACT|nr:hypothetical protein [uncultured Dysgonomonas sp.]SBW07207.1 conserved membrane hypothetical protein [uncultured Dysgonomonas sp.]
MTKKDFFRLVIKLFGLYLITLAPYTFSTVIVTLSYGADLLTIGASALMIAAYLGFAVLLIAYADVVIRFLRLEKGFDDDRIDISDINMQKLVSLAVIIVGGILVVYNFSLVLIALLHILMALVSNNKDDILSFNTYNINYTDLIDFIIGLLLITNYKRIARFVAKKGEQ